MRLLFVAMSDSIHTARWISQVADQGWDIHLFPSIDRGATHPGFRNISVYHSIYRYSKGRPPGVKIYGIPFFSNFALSCGRLLLDRIGSQLQILRLGYLIKTLKPDIIHSMEIQAAGYLTQEVKKRFTGQFPPWIVTNWGSDIYLFGRLSAHAEKIRAVLQACDYYSCECQRDVWLAKDMGFTGNVLQVIPNSSGYDLAHCYNLRQPGKTSERKLIFLKGYQSFAGRALVGLRAIALCANELKGYKVAVFVANPDVAIAAELVSRSTGIPIEVIPPCSHDDILRYYGQSRIYIGLSISDAISTSLLESMIMGAFPIQSCTACADEWIQDGKSGFIVPPEDPEIVAEALRRALKNDQLVDEAAALNSETAKERLDQTRIKPVVIQMYKNIVSTQPRSESSRI